MTTVVRAAALLSCVLALNTSHAQESKGSISGRVVNAVSGSALRKVNLTLSPTRGEGKPATAVTDDAGHFEFRDLAPGGYKLSGERSGFARQDYGARSNPQSGTILALQAGQAVTELTFKLAPNAVISGRVIDQDGNPLPNVIIAALRKAYRNGRRQWTQTGGTQTNDRGEYRISGLRAGQYLVAATNLQMDIGLAGVSKEPPSRKPEYGYAATYYGNATELSRAEPLDVRLGEDRRGTDIQMTRIPTVRVRGKIVGDISGKMLIMALIRKGSAEMGASPGSVGLVQQADGTFELRNVAPGSYFLSARSATDMLGGGTPMPLKCPAST
ncbi:MAG TPA: carboxypeptidase-like regulatory domain-containing protein [Bryobacteraceae bacterium]|nr:carboxypeptidase-like regulatory domain-containing protein [Bryobacteraceae bacterium]